MILRSVYLQHFRSYVQQKFDFSDTLTVIVGPNTAGKTNLSEAIHLLSTGKSFRTSTDSQMIEFGQEIGRVGALLEENGEKTKTEVVLMQGSMHGGRFSKRFLINGIGKSRASVRSLLPLVLFRPEELDIVIASPSIRREFLDNVLEQTDKEYYEASIGYQKALRQRNALLSIAQETGHKNKEHFLYWDNLLIQHGQILTQKREEFILFLNTMEKDVFDVQVVYDHSKISEERLSQYEAAEIGAGNTLVGPHRDDFYMTMEVENPSTSRKEEKNIKHFGSRGQQRLVVLQLKLLQIAYMKEKLQKAPLLVLDDIFSELDSGHIQLVLDKVKGCQIILTTTHKEFLSGSLQDNFAMIELGKQDSLEL